MIYLNRRDTINEFLALERATIFSKKPAKVFLDVWLLTMLSTPSTSHVDYNRIYEPAEDSFLLLDTLSSSSETAFFRNRFPQDTRAPLVVEVGTGSGVVLAFVAAHAEQLFGRSDIATLGTDVNLFACFASQQTVRTAVDLSRNGRGGAGEFLDCLNVDLTTALRPNAIDVLIFNPPYVPSEDLPSIPGPEVYQSAGDRFNHDSHLLSLSTDGGLDGMETTNRVLNELKSVLSTRGLAYILLCAQNKPEQIIGTVESWSNDLQEAIPTQWRAAKVGWSGRKAGWERLCVLRIWRETVSQ